MAKENKPAKGDNLLFYASGPVALHKVRPLTPEEIKAACERWRQTFRDSLENNAKESSKVMIVHGKTKAKVDFDLSECLLEHNWEDIKEQYSIGLIGKEVQVLYSGHHNKPTITEYDLPSDSFRCTFRNGAEYWYDGEDIRKKF